LFHYTLSYSSTIFCALYRTAKLSYEKLIKLSGIDGQVLFPELGRPEADVDAASVEKMFATFYMSRYKQFVATLKFGSEMASQVTISPPPTSSVFQQNFDFVEVEMEQTIDIKGVKENDTTKPRQVTWLGWKILRQSAQSRFPK